MSIETIIDLEFNGIHSYDSLRCFRLKMLFDENGKMVDFDNSTGVVCKNPKRFIEMGKAVERAIKIEGDTAKNLYKIVFNIEKEYREDIEKLHKETNLSKYEQRKKILYNEIKNLRDSFNRARKEDKKIALQKDIDSIYDEIKFINKKYISVIEKKETIIRKNYYKKLNELIVEF